MKSNIIVIVGVLSLTGCGAASSSGLAQRGHTLLQVESVCRNMSYQLRVIARHTILAADPADAKSQVEKGATESAHLLETVLGQIKSSSLGSHGGFPAGTLYGLSVGATGFAKLARELHHISGMRFAAGGRHMISAYNALSDAVLQACR
jgi:hypothetical protein